MISLIMGERYVFHDHIRKFCTENELNFYCNNTHGKCVEYTISGEPSNIEELRSMLKSLETDYQIERKNRSIITKIKKLFK